MKYKLCVIKIKIEILSKPKLKFNIVVKCS